MALVVSSTPLSSLWAATESTVTATTDERRPAERASSSSSSSRRLSSGSSGAETCESSSGSFGTQRSNSSSNASAAQTAPSTKQNKGKKKRGRQPDVVIHVQDCSFAVHQRVLKLKCRVLHSFLLRLRAQNAVGDLAEADFDDAEPIPLYSVSGIVTGEALPDEQTSKVFKKGGFVLRQRNPLTTPRGSTSQSHRQRCPVLPRQHLSDRAAPSASSKSTRFSKVCCIAHQKSDDEVEAQRPRLAAEKEFQREEYSPGKENYVSTLSSSTVRPRPLSRIALAPKMPFMGVSPSHAGPRGTVVPAVNSLAVASTPSSQTSSDTSSRVAPDALDVELVGATADAVATLIEFVYSGKTSGINESNAAVVTGLCKWFCMENHLFYAALKIRARSLHSVDEWIDILLLCTNLRFETHKKVMIDYLLGRLVGLPTTEFINVMQQIPLQRLAAIEDPDILARVLLCMVNHLRHLEIWKRLTFALELWQLWTYHVPYVASSYDHARQIPADKPMSLLDFHHQFVSWDPMLNLRAAEVSGIDAYVAPTTLFAVGPYVFQVRFEPKGKPLILWRVVRAGTPADAVEDNRSPFKPGCEAAFTIRGRLNLVYKVNAKSPVLQEEVVVRYTHTKETYAKWEVLLSGPSARTKAYVEPESEEKNQEPDSSLEEETAPHEDSDAEATEVFPTLPPAPVGDQAEGSRDESSPFEPMTARFSGQLFTWGHRLCNLYHFLLLTTLFYQVPADSPAEVHREATLARMRELPVDTLLLVLESDRLRVPEGETTLAMTLAALCLSDFATMRYSLDQIRALFCCVRWTFVDLEQIMLILEHSRPELKMYELVEQQLHAAGTRGGFERRAPWGVSSKETPYRSTTTLIEFQIEAGDRSLSPSKYLYSQE